MSHSEQNPLLQPFQRPPFLSIKPEHVKPAVEHAISDCRRAVEQAAKAIAEGKHADWNTVVAPLEEADDQLNKIWSPVSHLNAVVSSDALREAHDGCLPLLSEYGTYVGQHEGLYRAYLALQESDAFKQLTPAQQRVVNEAVKDFKLSGVGLPQAQKERYGEIQARLSELSSTFSNQVLDATHAWHCHITHSEKLAGLPESAREAAAEEAKARSLEGWVFTLDIPSYLPVMLYAQDRALREEMYRAYTTRASELGPNAGEFDNTAIIEETLALRHELAQLLGFEHYAALSLENKMAESADHV